MGRTYRGLNKKQREKFGKSRKQRQEKRRVQADQELPDGKKLKVQYDENEEWIK